MKVVKILAVIAVCLGAPCSLTWHVVKMSWRVERDTEAWLQRAQVAAKPAEMVSFLVSAQEGMSKHGLTTGSAALKWKTPENDMALIMENLVRIIERAKMIERMSATSTEYQVALDDLRGTLRELKLHASDRFYVDRWYWYLIMPVVWLAGIVGCCTIMVCAISL